MSAVATMPGMLRPATQSALFSERAAPSKLARRATTLAKSLDAGTVSGGGELSVIEIEALLRDSVKKKYDSLQLAFQNYDIDKSLSITRGEFRRVIETYCFPMTSEQFEAVLAKVNINKNGTINYCNFLDKFYGANVSTGGENWTSGTHRYLAMHSSKEQLNIDQIEKALRQTITSNLKDIIKAFYLFDYNRDGKIQRHELRKVLENYAFKFTDVQFDKLWQRYDFHHTGLLDYREFLHRLGVSVATSKLTESHLQGTKEGIKWSKGLKASFVPQTKTGLAGPDDSLAGMNFDQIEIEFRKRMVKNNKHLQRICLTFDPDGTGFISLENFKSILSSFTIPMSDQLFNQLMERCSIKATGKVAWELILQKFQDPQARGNGQTIPIKKNHKFFPIRETEEVTSANELLELLQSHIENCYPSFKEAFLSIDKNRDGKITRRELRQIVDKFKIKLSEEEFKLLFGYLDPAVTNRIKYHSFLELFEPRETHEGHKWLNSVHRFNDIPKPAILAWETVEEILRDKIIDNWKVISEALVHYGDQHTGKIRGKKLRKVICRFCLPISTQHFNALVDRCEDMTEDKVNYREFMYKLGVEVRPGDMVGLSTQITQQSEALERKRQLEHDNRSDMTVNHALEKTETMTTDEIIVRLKDRMSQHDSQIRKSFLTYCKTGKGTITKRAFREVLAGFGMHLSDEQFHDLVHSLGFHKGKINYSDFVDVFDDPRGSLMVSQDGGNVHTPNHRVNAIRGGDEISMSAEQAVQKLLSKLRENFADLRSAFYKFDEDHNGILTKDNFRRLTDSFMVTLSDYEFDRLCEMIGVHKGSRVTYEDFLNRFEVIDTLEGHKWLISDHTWNETFEPQCKSADEIGEILAKKVHQQWKDLSKAFMTFDSEGNGIIRRKDLRAILARFYLTATREEFKKLWARYDVSGKGYISHQDFLRHLGASEFTPGDINGMSKRIVDDSYAYLNKHHSEQLEKHEQITLNQATRASSMTVDQVERQLRDRIRDYYPSMYTAFQAYDTDKKGYISVKAFQKVLVDLNYFLNDEQFFELLDRVGLKSNTSKLSYEQFLQAFEDGRKSSYGREEDFRLEQYDHLSANDADIKLRNKITSQGQVLQSAFKAFDTDNSGRIPISEFRRILDNFCFKMSDAQFKHMLNRMSAQGDNSVDYHRFMDLYREPQQQSDVPFWRKDLQDGPMFAMPKIDQDEDQWLDTVNKIAPPPSPWTVSASDMLSQLQEIVTARFYQFARAFADTDYAKIGVVARDDMRRIIHVNAFRLSDEQFNNVWSNLKVNEFGNVDYRDFLKRFSSAPPTPPAELRRSRMGRESAMLQRRPATQQSNRPNSRMAEMFSPRQLVSRAQGASPLVNAEMVELKIRDRLYKHWQFVQKSCRVVDPPSRGEIEASTMRDILSKCGVILHDYEYNQLKTKYDIDNNGYFHYQQFLRNLVLPPSRTEGPDKSVLLARKKLHQSKVPLSAGIETPFFYEAMLRLRPSVLKSWKEMRRMFRGLDKTANGVVSPNEFRAVLKQFGVNLSEDEFYHLMTYYDKDLRGHISYNDFIGEFLKTA